MDADTKAYLDEFKKDIKESLKSLEDHIKDLINKTIAPIEKQVDKHSNDIGDLYEIDRDMRDRVGCIEGRVKTLEDDKDDGRFSKEIRVAVGIGVGSIVVALIAVAVSFL